MQYSICPDPHADDNPPDKKALDEFCLMLAASFRMQDELWNEFMRSNTRKRFRDWLKGCWFFTNAGPKHIEWIIGSIIGHY